MSEKATFFELAGMLDQLIALEAPAPAQVERAMCLIADKALERYFFRHLAEARNVRWFQSLRERGLFNAPPDFTPDSMTSYPEWHPLWYLVAIAPQCPEEFVDTVRRIRAPNRYVMLHLVEAASSIAPEHAARLVPVVLDWTSRGMEAGDGVVSLAAHLARGDQWDAALKLVDAIVSPSTADAIGTMEFFERELPFFTEHRPLDILSILERNLEKAVEIEDRQGSDLSWIWRPAVEPHEQNRSLQELKSQLVDAALQALASSTGMQPEEARRMVQAWLLHRYSIFRRLAIHTIRLNRSRWPDLVSLLFTEQKYLDDSEVYHEYWLLMHEALASLPTAVRDAFVKRLLDRLPQREMVSSEAYHSQRRWVLRRLYAIRDCLSDDQQRQVLADLVSEYGIPEHPSFLSYSSVSWESASTKTSGQLVSMQEAEILAELKKGLPYEGFGQPDQEGLANALRAAIVENPQHFVRIAPHLIGTDIAPVYADHALWGFQEAWTQGKQFDWEPLVELCELVAATVPRAGTVQPPDISPGYWQTTHASARNWVANLLETAVVREDHAIPRQLLSRVRDILLVLADDPNPSVEYERTWGLQSPMGVLNLALNVTRGKALEALLQYALHVAHLSEQGQAPGETTFADGSRIEAAARDKLTQKLDKQTDPSLAVHSILGRYLPALYYLDKDWLVAHLEEIFPRQATMAVYWQAAWDGYLFRSDFFGYLYPVLRPYYRHAVEQLAMRTEASAGSDLSRRRLAAHLAIVYWRGVEALQGDDSLVAMFFQAASDDLRAAFILVLEDGLRTSPGLDSKQWSRAKILWQERFLAILHSMKTEPGVGRFVKELAAFAGWVPFIPENLAGFYNMIELSALACERWETVELLQFLSSVTRDHLVFVVCLLEKLVQREEWPRFLASKAEMVRSILELAITSGDAEAKSCAVRVINLFGMRGDERYRDLLNLA